jgi:transposase
MLSSGETGDAPQGRVLLEKMGPQGEVIALLMDCAYEGDETRNKKRNEVERFFRRYDRYRRIFTRYDKLDVMFLTYFTFALIVDALIK